MDFASAGGKPSALMAKSLREVLASIWGGGRGMYVEGWVLAGNSQCVAPAAYGGTQTRTIGLQ